MGGRIFSMLSWGPMRLKSTPRSYIPFTTRLASALAGAFEPRSLTSSTAKNIPEPRTSPMSG